MAKLIPWENLMPGMTVWEECKWSDVAKSIIRADVIGRLETGVLMHYHLLFTEYAETRKASSEIRYWDAEPTLDEREGAPWE